MFPSPAIIKRGPVLNGPTALPATTEMLVLDASGNITTQSIPVASFGALTGSPSDNAALSSALAGKLTGSLGSTDNRVLRTDGTGGLTAQGSAVTIDDSGNVTGLASVSAGNGSLSASAPVLVLAQTWNNGSVAFNAIDCNVTDTASVIQSTFATFRRNGSNRIVLWDKYDNVAQQPAIQFASAVFQGASGGHVALGTTGDTGMVGLTNGMGLSMNPSRFIGWGSTGNAVRNQGSSWTDTRLQRNAAGQLDVRGDSGLRVRDLVSSADAPFSASSGTFSGPINVTSTSNSNIGPVSSRFVFDINTPGAGGRIYWNDNSSGNMMALIGRTDQSALLWIVTSVSPFIGRGAEDGANRVGFNFGTGSVTLSGNSGYTSTSCHFLMPNRTSQIRLGTQGGSGPGVAIGCGANGSADIYTYNGQNIVASFWSTNAVSPGLCFRNGHGIYFSSAATPDANAWDAAVLRSTNVVVTAADNGLNVMNKAQNAKATLRAGNGDFNSNLSVTGYLTNGFQTLVADPSTVDITTGLSRMVKNSTSGELRLWANDSGSMKSTLLS